MTTCAGNKIRIIYFKAGRAALWHFFLSHAHMSCYNVPDVSDDRTLSGPADSYCKEDFLGNILERLLPWTLGTSQSPCGLLSFHRSFPNFQWCDQLGAARLSLCFSHAGYIWSLTDSLNFPRLLCKWISWAIRHLLLMDGARLALLSARSQDDEVESVLSGLLAVPVSAAPSWAL